jgi:hypothetical protein
MAQAEAGIFFSGVLSRVLAQSIGVDAAGVAAVAIVSQSGPSRTSIITARMTKVAMRTNRDSGRTRRDMRASYMGH